MKIVFAYFRSPDFRTVGSVLSDSMSLPLGLGSVRAFAAADKRIARRARMVNKVFPDGTSAREAADEVLAQAPGVAAFGCYLWNVGKTAAACRLIKKRAPRVVTVVGGPEVPRRGPELAGFMRRNAQFDVAVPGEGETPFAEAVSVLVGLRRGLAGVEGIAYREGGRVQVTAPAPSPQDLGRLPSPYLVGAIEVRGGADRMLTIETSRGCPFSCSFCHFHASRHRLGFFPVARLEAELELLERRGFGGIVYIVDPTINVDKRHALAVFSLLKGYDFSFGLEMKAENMDDELIAALARIPSAHAAIGIQSIHPAVMRNIGRPFDPRKSRENIGKLLRHGNVEVHLDVLLGLPGDDYEGVKKTLDWTLGFRPAPKVAMHTLVVLPNTDLARDAERFRIRTGAGRRVVSNYSFCGRDMAKAQRLAAAYDLLLAERKALESFHGLLHGGAGRPSGVLEHVAGAMAEAGLFRRQGEMPRARGTPPSVVPGFLERCLSSWGARKGRAKIML